MTEREQVRILVVEDEAMVAEEIAIRLQRRGYQTLGPVDTAARAIQLVSEELPDLVLMDIRLKGDVDGITAAEEIHRTYDVPVVFLTANADDATYRRARMAAQYGYVLKPFHERDLLMALDLAVHRSRVERELRRTNLTHATISAAVQVGIVATDASGLIRFVNPAAEQLLGRALIDLVGRSFTATLTPVDEVTGAPLELPTLEPGTLRHHAVARIRTTSGEVPLDVNVTPIVNGDGRAVGTVWTLRDLRAERRQQLRLREQEKLAAVGQLAAGIAHEFNNLLTVITGSADLLADGDPSDAVGNRELSDSIVEASRRAAVLVEQLLHFSRQAPEGEPDADANAVIVGMEGLLRVVLGDSIELQLRLEEHLGRVRLTAPELEEAVLAIARNAREAIPGAGRVTIVSKRVALDAGDLSWDALRDASATGYAVELSLSDTGVGIATAHLPRVFEPFYTTKEPGQGPGLGLSTVFATVRRARGHVDAVSEAGQGTTIRLLLPECAPPFTDRALGPRATPAVASLLDGSVLLVEDDPTVRAVTSRILRNQGFTVVEADEGAGALAILRDPSQKIGLLITDIALPNGSGLDLMLQARVVQKDLPVLLTSGHATDTRWRSLITATDAPFLPKPFTRQQLEQAIADTLAAV